MSRLGEITKEVSTTEHTVYLVRGDGVEMFIVDNEEDAKLALESLAAHDAKILKKKRTKVFLEALDDGAKLVLSTQKIGKYIYNSSPETSVTFDMVPVKKAIIKRKPCILTPDQLEKTVKEEEENEEVCMV